MRLFCFPHAGGGSLAYLAWPAELGPEIEVCAVQLPGRENRLRESAFNDLKLLRERLAEVLLPALDQTPFAFFGHSFGALVAFELARELRRRGAPLPRLLVAAGRAAPSRGGVARPLSALLDDDEFIDEIARRYGGIPAKLRAERDLLALILPTLRADLKLAEAYEHHPEPPLPLPIQVFGGSNDPGVGEQDLQGWSRETTARFGVQILPGGHFFVQEARQDLLRAIRALILEC